MTRNGHTNGHPANCLLRRVDSRSLSAEDLSAALDYLRSTQNAARESEQFSKLVQLLDGVTKVNPRQHITGSVGDRDLLRRVVQVYQQDPASRAAFLEHVARLGIVEEAELGRFFLQSEDDLIRWFQMHTGLSGDAEGLKEANERLDLVRLAIESETPEAVALRRECCRIVALENAAHGVSEVWLRTSLGDLEGAFYGDAAADALDGVEEANCGSIPAVNVRFLVGLQHRRPGVVAEAQPAESTEIRWEKLAEAVASLRDRMPGGKGALLGIDGGEMDAHESTAFEASASSAVIANRLHLAVHFGESWDEGELLAKLERLSELVNHGEIHQLDNANALFAVKDLLLPHQQYSNDEWVEIRRLQLSIFHSITDRGIVLGISPTSNDLLTRSLRLREGWRFRALTEPLGVGRPSVADQMLSWGYGRLPLIIVVGNDNSLLYPSRIAGGLLTVSEELANLWDARGSINFSVYGKLPTRLLAQLIHNGFMLTEAANNGWFDPTQHPQFVVPEVAQIQVPRVVKEPYAIVWCPNEVPRESTHFPGDSPGIR